LIPGLKHYIISYDMLVPKVKTMKKSGKVVRSGYDIAQFDKVGIKTIILDECQQIKNADSSRTQMVRRVAKGRKVIALSGTPWNNRGSELFPVLNMMDPIKFNSAEGFKHDWVETFWQGNTLKEGGIKYIKRFREHTKDLLIRRERTEVMSELPLVNRTKLNVVLDQTQESIYDAAVEDFVRWYEDHVEELTGMAIIAAMQKMRHLVALAKIPATQEYIEEFVEDTDRKIVVFAHHKDVQSILYEEFKEKYGKDLKDKDGEIIRKAIPVLRIIADMNGHERNEAALKFNESPRAIMVASQLASGEGLNLQTCSDCVMHERQWNPGREEQCEGRFIRIGQLATSVNAIYVQLEGLTTIDPQLDGIVEGKRVRFHAGMNKTEMQSWSEDAIMKDLAAVIVAAHRRKYPDSGKKAS
jgi:SNF2 family DNA or RNA helicase